MRKAITLLFFGLAGILLCIFFTAWIPELASRATVALAPNVYHQVADSPLPPAPPHQAPTRLVWGITPPDPKTPKKTAGRLVLTFKVPGKPAFWWVEGYGWVWLHRAARALAFLISTSKDEVRDEVCTVQRSFKIKLSFLEKIEARVAASRLGKILRVMQVCMVLPDLPVRTEAEIKDAKVRDLVATLLIWASRARREEVIVVRGIEHLASTPIVNFDVGVRSGGRSGLHVLEVWAEENRQDLINLFAEAKGYQSDPNGERSWAPEVTSMLSHMQALELPKSLGDNEAEAQADALSVICQASTKDGSNDLSKGEAWLPVAAPQSNSLIRLFWQGVPTPLARAISGLANDTVELVMYVLSLLNAKILGFMPGSKHGEVSEYKLVVCDLSKPLFITPEGIHRYANTCGGDGNMFFSWSDGEKKDTQGQIRGFVLNLLKKFGLLLKGTAVGDHIWLTPDCQGFTSVWEPGCHKVVAADLNMVKGKGKETKQYQTASSCQNPLAVPYLVTEGELYLWFIRVVKSAEEHRGELSTTFQETPFYPAPVEGEEGLGGTYTKVDADTLTANLIDRICKIDDTRRQLVDECLSSVSVCLNDFRLGNGEIPYCAVLESVNGDLERAFSSGTFRKGQTLKAWGNQLTPCGVVLMDHRQMAYRHYDEEQASNTRNKMGKTDYFDSKYYKKGFGLFGRLVAHRRTPQLNPLSLTTSRAICHEDLKSLAEAILNQSSEWLTYDGFLLNTHQSILEMMNWHNSKVQDKGYAESGSEWGKVVLDAEAFALRIVEWHLSLQHSKIESWFVTAPLDGRDRNEDHDGDDSMCCPSRFWVEKYLELERFWRRMAHPFINELPKSTKMDWRADRVRQELPDPDGKMVSTTNIKGCLLQELFPSIEWCTPARLKAISLVTLADPQGPTGLASNVAADLFARIRWSLDPKKRKNWRNECLIVPHPEDYNLFLLWVWYCLLVQICIDWQKRAYELPKLKYAFVVAQAVIDAGWKGLKNFEKVLNRSDLADLDTKMSWVTRETEVRELDTNWCYNPALIYSFAENAIEKPVCIWKWKRGKLEWKASRAEIEEDLRSMPANRFRAVGLAVGKILEDFGGAKDYVERIANSVKQGTENNELSSKIAQAFLVIETETLKAGEDGDLEKVSASYRGGLFLRALGFDPDAQEALLADMTAKSTLTGDVEWSWPQLLAAAAHGAAGREVDAFEILVSFYVAQKEVSEGAKKLIAYGDELKEDFLRGVALSPQGGSIKPSKKGENILHVRSMSKDLQGLWHDVFNSGYDYFEASVESIANMAYEASDNPEEQLALAKMAANRLFSVVQVARVYKDRVGHHRVMGKSVVSHRNPIALSSSAYQAELERNPNTLVKGNRNSAIREGENGLYVASSNGKSRAPHLSNWDNSHAWLSAIGNDCPVAMAYQAVVNGRPFVAHPNVAQAYEIMNRLWTWDENILIKSRTLTTSGGYLSVGLVDKAIDLVYGDDWEHDGEEPVRGGVIAAIQLLRGASSNLVSRWDKEFVDGNATPEFFRQELMDGKCGMFPVPLEENNWGHWLKDNFGLTPLPMFLSYGVGEKRVFGWNALEKVLEGLLIYVLVKKHIKFTDEETSDRCDEYNRAKDEWKQIVEEYNLPLNLEGGKCLYWFTAMAVDDKSTVSDKVKRFKRYGALVRAYQELGQ